MIVSHGPKEQDRNRRVTVRGTGLAATLLDTNAPASAIGVAEILYLVIEVFLAGIAHLALAVEDTDTAHARAVPFPQEATSVPEALAEIGRAHV